MPKPISLNELIHQMPEPVWQKWMEYCRNQITLPDMEMYNTFMKQINKKKLIDTVFMFTL